MISFVSNNYYPSIGGTQMLCKYLAEWFQSQGEDIEIITSYDKNREDLGYKINNLPDTSSQWDEFFNNKRYKSTFVFADLFSPFILPLKADKINNSILVLNLDENVYKWIKQGKIKDINKRVEAIKKYNHVVSFCQGAPINKFLEENNIQYKFIPNFCRDVKNSPKSNLISKESLGIDKKILLNHSVIEIRKNQLSLIKSFINSNLSEDYHLVLLGPSRSKEMDRYLQQCKLLIDSNPSITLLEGTNDQTIINSLLSISDVYILSSTAEGLPLVLLEAMSADLPWVSTPVGGVPKVFGNLKGGKVLESFNLSNIEGVIREVEGNSSRKEWEENFTPNISGMKYKKLL